MHPRLHIDAQYFKVTFSYPLEGKVSFAPVEIKENKAYEMFRDLYRLVKSSQVYVDSILVNKEKKPFINVINETEPKHNQPLEEFVDNVILQNNKKAKNLRPQIIMNFHQFGLLQFVSSYIGNLIPSDELGYSICWDPKKSKSNFEFDEEINTIIYTQTVTCNRVRDNNLGKEINKKNIIIATAQVKMKINDDFKSVKVEPTDIYIETTNFANNEGKEFNFGNSYKEYGITSIEQAEYQGKLEENNKVFPPENNEIKINLPFKNSTSGDNNSKTKNKITPKSEDDYSYFKKNVVISDAKKISASTYNNKFYINGKSVENINNNTSEEELKKFFITNLFQNKENHPLLQPLLDNHYKLLHVDISQIQHLSVSEGLGKSTTIYIDFNLRYVNIAFEEETNSITYTITSSARKATVKDFDDDMPVDFQCCKDDLDLVVSTCQVKIKPQDQSDTPEVTPIYIGVKHFSVNLSQDNLDEIFSKMTNITCANEVETQKIFLKHKEIFKDDFQIKPQPSWFRRHWKAIALAVACGVMIAIALTGIGLIVQIGALGGGILAANIAAYVGVNMSWLIPASFAAGFSWGAFVAYFDKQWESARSGEWRYRARKILNGVTWGFLALEAAFIVTFIPGVREFVGLYSLYHAVVAGVSVILASTVAVLRTKPTQQEKQDRKKEGGEQQKTTTKEIILESANTTPVSCSSVSASPPPPTTPPLGNKIESKETTEVPEITNDENGINHQTPVKDNFHVPASTTATPLSAFGSPTSILGTPLTPHTAVKNTVVSSNLNIGSIINGQQTLVPTKLKFDNAEKKLNVLNSTKVSPSTFQPPVLGIGVFSRSKSFSEGIKINKVTKERRLSESCGSPKTT